jgi:NAD-dependent dihydropyrimidine dehydrogenase PreA subunit
MDITSLKLVCFSPTKTSKTIIQGIAHGINHGTAELIDITRPDARKQQLQTSEHELLVVAVPVYCGRVPTPAAEWLQSLKAHQTPAVCVVVYGNRAFDDALLELKDIMTKQGCRPIACGAYIGEHSFSDSEIPLAAARPDAGDLGHAEQFGRKIQEKLRSASSSDRFTEFNVPGNRPYRDPCSLGPVDFIAVSETCSQCGFCQEECPAGAIDLEHNVACDKNKCLVCCACIKDCPEHARTVIPGIVKDIAANLSKTCKERKEPEYFL